MTVILGKKQINLGWETAIAIVSFLIVTSWGASQFTVNYLHKQDEIYKAVVNQAKKDSIYDAKLYKVDTLDSWVTGNKKAIDGIKSDVAEIKGTIRGWRQIKYYTEKRTPTGTEIIPVKKDRS